METNGSSGSSAADNNRPEGAERQNRPEGQDGPKKRRRGSRGGKNRRKPGEGGEQGEGQASAPRPASR